MKIVSFFFSLQHIDMTKFGYLYICQVDCGSRWVFIYVSQDMIQSLVTTTSVFVSLSKLLPLAAGAFLKTKGHQGDQHKAESEPCITSGGHLWSDSSLISWKAGKQTLKSFIWTPTFLVGSNYSANLPLAKLISVILVLTSLISS